MLNFKSSLKALGAASLLGLSAMTMAAPASAQSLADVLKRRQELRAFREGIYGHDQLDSIMDMEDEVNENFDKLCASMQAPAWPTPRI